MFDLHPLPLQRSHNPVDSLLQPLSLLVVSNVWMLEVLLCKCKFKLKKLIVVILFLNCIVCCANVCCVNHYCACCVVQFVCMKEVERQICIMSDLTKIQREIEDIDDEKKDTVLVFVVEKRNIFGLHSCGASQQKAVNNSFFTAVNVAWTLDSSSHQRRQLQLA